MFTSKMTKSFKKIGSRQQNVTQGHRRGLGKPPAYTDIGIEDTWDLAIRTTKTISSDDVHISVWPCASDNAVLVSVQPPQQPRNEIQHVPCDIVLVIDVSGSMASLASLPRGAMTGENEDTGLTILDLTKHAARTVLESMNDNDRLGIVTFATNAQVIQPLTPMTCKARQDSWNRIDKLQDQDSTNLWGGIRKGLSLFENATQMNNVQGMFVLTDGQPNHMCPHQGYVPKLKPMLAKMRDQRGQTPMIHTFGFGYSIRSGLLQSLAEAGNGSYAFIPDAGMIGTVFVHAISNLYSTFAVDASITVETSDMLNLEHNSGLAYEKGDENQIIVHLGSMQYGQSRDIVLQCAGSEFLTGTISVTTQYRHPEHGQQIVKASTVLQQNTELPKNVLQYHLIRTELCALLGQLFPRNGEEEHVPLDIENEKGTDFETIKSRFRALEAYIRDLDSMQDPKIRSLLEDLTGAEPHGQISKALESQIAHSHGRASNWRRWGQHYLPSLSHAHIRQTCNSFKDSGPLCYGIESPLFIKCRSELDDKFDNLPAPKPTSRVRDHYNGHSSGGSLRSRKMISMKMYNSSSNPCFKGSCEIRLDNDSSIPILKLRPGMQVWTPVGARRVSAVVRTAAAQSGPQVLCRVGDLWITPWHPLKHNSKWSFPADISEAAEVQVNGSVISVLLEASDDPEAHVVEVGGQLVVTLGHGITSDSNGSGDVRAHTFFGNYAAVVQSLSGMLRDKSHVLQCRGMKKDTETGLACGFLGRTDLLVQTCAGFGVPHEEDWAAEKIGVREFPEHLLSL